MTALWERSGHQALAGAAPEAAADLARIVAGRPHGLDGLAALARATCAETLGLAPLPMTVPPVVEPAAAAFAEQFSLDVSAVTDAQRAALDAALGDAAGEYVLAVYAADWVPRVRRTLDSLFAARASWPDDSAQPVTSIWPAIEALLGSVARLPLLDPVLTELVRLRGARQHNCRMCKSLRSAPAMAAGADEDLFDAVDDYAHAGLTGRRKAALALTDAMIWQPAHLPSEVLDGIRRYFAAEEAVELVLDIARNAVNKVAVACGADEAAVPDGLQSYTVHADGSVEFGARIPRV